MESILEKEPGTTLPPLRSGGGDKPSVLLVSCVIRPEKLDPVKDALDRLNLVGGMTVTDVRGFGRQKGSIEHYRGGEIQVRLIDKVKLDLIISENDADGVIQTIKEKAHTGNVGDGKIFVTEIQKVMRVRTGEMGLSAL